LLYCGRFVHWFICYLAVYRHTLARC